MTTPVSVNELNKLLFEQSPDGIFIDDGTGYFIDVNTTLCQWLGYSRNEFLQFHISDLVGKETLQHDPLQHAVLKVGKTVIKERKFICKNGNFIPVELTARSMPDGHILVHVRDISLRHAAYLALKENEEKYRQIAENTSDVIWMMDMQMHYTYVSPSIFKQRGYTPEEFLTLKPEEIYTEESLKMVSEIYHVYSGKALHGELKRDFNMTVELEHRCKNGSTRFSEVMMNIIFDQEQRAIGIHGVSREISDRKQAEEKVREAEERFRLAFQTSPDSININRMEDGIYIEINEGFTKLSGYTAEEVIGRTSIEINIWEDPLKRDELVKLLKENNAVRNFEARFRFKDGAVRTGLMSAAIILLKGVKHIISITRDIEEIKQAETDLKQAKEKAEESSRLKTAFLNNISHEIRTPMNAILGFTDLLQSEENTEEEKDRYFGIINSNSRQLLSIIDDVLEISRMDSGRIPVNPVTFSLHELMEDIYFSMSEMIIKKDIRLVCDNCKEIISDKIFADREKIRQVIVGLIENSIKYTRKGEINFGYTLTGIKAEFYVRDTGIGIEKTECEKIFERFYQVHQGRGHETRGTGLGLSIAKGLVEMMQGEIRVESEPGQGSVFTFNVPLLKTPYTTPRIKTNEQAFSFSDLIILIAEDEEFNFEFLQILFSRKVKKIVWARNGGEVMPLVEKEHPDLILMDIKMPVLNGIDATIQLKKKFPKLPVIALTAYTQPEDERNALQAGCAAFVCKPVSPHELLETIKRILNRKLLLNPDISS